jgi:hypothetical protein
VNILQAMSDRKLFKPWIKDERTWTAWRAFLATLFHLPMDEEQKAIVLSCTALEALPERAFDEAWLVVGRRGGKSLVMAMVAVFLALFKDWTSSMVPGERATVLVLASDKKQAKTILRYATALVEEVPLLASKIERVTSEEIEFRGRVALEIGTASYRSVRGRTLVAAILDELAFFRSDESANPDVEILDAIRPAMATMPGSMLICASSPYARRGALWETYRRWYGKLDAPCLVWQAPTRTMNPTLKQRVVDEAYERDAAAASAEYGAQFRNDIDAFISREAIDAVTIPERRELYPVPGQHYVAFVDPSGGSSDAMTLAIAHVLRKDGKALVILDCVREQKPPFSPEATVASFVETLKSYRIHKVTGDRYGGEWCREPFRKLGVSYELSEKNKSEIYQATLPILNSGNVELLDHPKLAAQFVGLERRTARSGRDSIDHAPGAHDDLVNAACGAISLVSTAQPIDWGKLLEAERRTPPYPGTDGWRRIHGYGADPTPYIRAMGLGIKR